MPTIFQLIQDLSSCQKNTSSSNTFASSGVTISKTTTTSCGVFLSVFWETITKNGAATGFSVIYPLPKIQGPDTNNNWKVSFERKSLITDASLNEFMIDLGFEWTGNQDSNNITLTKKGSDSQVILTGNNLKVDNEDKSTGNAPKSLGVDDDDWVNVKGNVVIPGNYHLYSDLIIDATANIRLSFAKYKQTTELSQYEREIRVPLWTVLYGLIDDSDGKLINPRTGEIIPGPKPPNPFRDMIAQIVIHETAGLINDKSGEDVQKAALQGISNIVAKQLDKLSK